MGARCTQPSVPGKSPGHCELGPEAHCQVQKWGGSRARVLHVAGGDCRRCRPSQGLQLGPFDAEDPRGPSRGGAATSWSPEATSSSMACGGVAVPHGDGARRRPRRRYGEGRRGERERGGSPAHPRCVRMLGDDGEDSRRPESGKKTGGDARGKSSTAARRRHPCTRGSTRS